MEYLYLILVVPFLIVVMAHIAVKKFGRETDKIAWASLPKAGLAPPFLAAAFPVLIFSKVSIEYKLVGFLLFIVSSIPLFLKQFRHIRDSGATVAYWLLPNAISGVILFLVLVALVAV